MIWFLGAFVILLLSAAFLYRNNEKELVNEERKKGNRLWFLLPMGFAIYDRAASLDPEHERNEEQARAVYIRDNPDRRLRVRGAVRVCVFWIGLLGASLLGIAAALLPSRQQEIQELQRPEFGKTTSYDLQVEGLESEPQSIRVEIDGREPSEEGMQEVFDEVFLGLKADILGDNDSLDEVRYDLELPAVGEYGIRIQWKSLNPEYISDLGHIRINAEEIPQEGVLAVLEATLSYSLYRCICEIPLRLVPPEEDQFRIGLLEEEIRQRNAGSLSEEKVILPAEFLGTRLSFRQKRQNPLSALAVLILLAGAAWVISDRQRLKEMSAKRNRQILSDYPSLVFKLGLMIGCGMTIRGAWYRIIAEYEKQRREGKEKRYLFEEMALARNEIEAGIGEGAAYAAFGHRCGEQCFIRLGNQLQQNLQQGIAGLSAMMDAELTAALEQKKHQMLKAGEIMETKMLLPMFLLLALVMAILVVPAFFSVG